VVSSDFAHRRKSGTQVFLLSKVNQANARNWPIRLFAKL